VAALLDQFAADPIHELAQLARAATFTAMIGNADAHGKNVAVLHEETGYITLAPLYDTVPTTMWPNLRGTAAMPVHGRRRLHAVTLEDMLDEAYLWPLDRRRARDVSVGTAEAILDALGSLAVPPELAERIAARCRSFLAA
ncbi:MAG: HipA domain-containing protein, partial [Acidimicrobiales bacterium]